MSFVGNFELGQNAQSFRQKYTQVIHTAEIAAITFYFWTETRKKCLNVSNCKRYFGSRACYRNNKQRIYSIEPSRKMRYKKNGKEWKDTDFNLLFGLMIRALMEPVVMFYILWHLKCLLSFVSKQKNNCVHTESIWFIYLFISSEVYFLLGFSLRYFVRMAYFIRLKVLWIGIFDCAFDFGTHK